MGRGRHRSRPVGRDGGPRSRGGRHTRPPRRAARLSPREGLRGLPQRTGPGRTEDRRPRDVGRTVGSHAIAIVPAGRARVRGQTRPAGGHGGHSRTGSMPELVGAAVAAGVQFLPRTEAGVGAVEGSARLVHLGCSGNARTIRANVVLAATGFGPLMPSQGRRSTDTHRSRVEHRGRLFPARRPQRVRSGDDPHGGG